MPARWRSSAARRETPVASATFLATMLDFADPGDIGVYVSRDGLAARKPALCGGGRVQGSELASAFASLRPNELVWNYVVGNYLKGQTPPAFDLLYWNGDSANLPGPMYVEYLRDMYLRQSPARARRALDVRAADRPRAHHHAFLCLATRAKTTSCRGEPHTDASACSEATLTFVLGASGHIAGVDQSAGEDSAQLLDQRTR